MGGPIFWSRRPALVLVPSATAYEVPSKLNEVAHVYSLGVGEVRCPSRAEWDADWASSFGWAYTNVREDYTVLGPVVCAGALGVGSADVPAWQQALGALVLTHEAFHLRHWRFRRNEGKVECQALANFRDATQRLGATAAQAEDLYPYALALHDYKVRLFPQYRETQDPCVAPAPPERGDRGHRRHRLYREPRGGGVGGGVRGRGRVWVEQPPTRTPHNWERGRT